MRDRYGQVKGTDVTGLPAFDPDLLPDADLASPALHAEYDLTALWRRMRDEEPVYWHPVAEEPDVSAPGFWAVTRHADAVAVLRDGQRFTSVSGNVLETLLAGGDSAAGKMLAVTDGPRHAEVRRLITAALTPALMDRIAERIATQVRELIRTALDAGTCDFGRDVAAAVPLATICDLLAVPDADRPHIHRLGSSSVSSHAATLTTTDAWTAKNELLSYFLDLAESRRGTGGDDLVTLLANARIKGRPLGTDEIVFNCYSLILGGDETTRLAMTGAVHALAAEPAQWHALRSGEVGIDSATEEVLRWTTPSRHLGRLATEPAVLGGREIGAGDVVTVWLASANFDEREFADPQRFALDRSPNRHVTFAYGPHFCVGARLGRIQLAATLAALRDLVAGIEVVGTPGHVYSNFLGGICDLPVVLKAA